MDDDNEAWLQTLRAKALRARGWKDSVRDYEELLVAMRRDPLDAGITSLEDLDDPALLSTFIG